VLKDRAWIEAHIPHQGSMCLLDSVLECDAERVRVASGAHRSPDHPLRAHGRLGAVCAVEVAAQAMAVHGAVLAPAPGSAIRQSGGHLVSLRGVRLHAARLDDISEDLIATATRLAGDERQVLYEFVVAAGARLVATGRATVVLRAEAALADGAR
jgi:predicted hotdog family 3-hydroxylacyl-ACP dehydratase